MSREVIGRTRTSPDAVGPPEPVGPTAAARPPEPQHVPAAPSGPRTRAALAVLLVLLAGTVGWTATRTWTGEQSAAALARTGRAQAVATGPVVLTPEVGRTRMTWTVALDNPGGGAVRFRLPRPSEVAAGQAGFLRAGPRQGVVVPGGQTRLLVESIVPCAGIDPIAAPTLLVRTGPGTERPVAVLGAWTLAVGACAVQPEATRPLSLRRADVVDGAFRLTLSSPTSRPWHVLAVAAGAQPLAGGDALVGHDETEVALTLPPGSTCPPDWQAVGVPQTLTVTLDGPEPTDVELPVGRSLSAWLLDAACPGPPR